MPPTHIQLRPATPTDLPAILALERATEGAPHWPLAAYAAIFEPLNPNAPSTTEPQRCLFVAQTIAQPTNQNLSQRINEPVPEDATAPHPAIVGFAVGLLSPGPSPAETVAELESIAVAASARRTGIGRALCSTVLDWCCDKGATAAILEVRVRSSAAIALYTQLGFTSIGRRSGYYRNPDDDALLLRLPLR